VYQPEYTVDGLHFSDDGCQVMAQTVYIRVRRLGM
jgi:lysophospholipase L1-like esterase